MSPRRAAPARALALAALVLLSACATPGPASRDAARPPAAGEDAGSCRPWFVADPDEAAPRSCWNRAWEVPAAIVAVPVVLAVIVGGATAPVWVPLVLFLK